MNAHAGQVAIYFLIDPRKPESVRYVGQTKTPQTRLIQHCCERGRSVKCEWMEQMISEGVLPQMVILETCQEDTADEREKLWITRFRLNGAEAGLTNKAAKAKPVRVDDATPDLLSYAPKTSPIKTLNQVEADVIRDMLARLKGNKLEAAKRLGIGRQTLYNKIKFYNIDI